MDDTVVVDNATNFLLEIRDQFDGGDPSVLPEWLGGETTNQFTLYEQALANAWLNKTSKLTTHTPTELLLDTKITKKLKNDLKSNFGVPSSLLTIGTALISVNHLEQNFVQKTLVSKYDLT